MNKQYVREISSQPSIATLQQLTNMTFDGDVMSKPDRDELWKAGLIERVDGWNIITPKGIKFLEKGGFIHP